MGREYDCEGVRCRLRHKWLRWPLVLHVDHKNGNWLDDRPENLGFTCPNCHSQTPNYCGSKGYAELTSTAKRCREHRKRKKGPVVEQADTCVLGAHARKGVRVRVPPGP